MTNKELMCLAEEARSLSYAPYSRFSVGAAYGNSPPVQTCHSRQCTAAAQNDMIPSCFCGKDLRIVRLCCRTVDQQQGRPVIRRQMFCTVSGEAGDVQLTHGIGRSQIGPGNAEPVFQKDPGKG